MIGVDIIYLPRFVRAVKMDGGGRFLERVFSESEISQCTKKTEDATMKSLAGRFAIKEAVIKASQGELNIVDLKIIKIRQSAVGYLKVFVDRKDVSCASYEVSMSHDGDYVVGIALKATE